MTAIDWLVQQMKLDELFNADYFIEQAKEIEKQQIIDAYEYGTIHYKNGEEYYNETFNKPKQ